MTFEEIVDLLVNRFGEEIILGANASVIQPFVTISSNSIAEVCQFLRETPGLYFDYLQCVTGIDNGEKAATMEVLYHMTSIPYGHNLVLKVELVRNTNDEPIPSLPSVSSIWKTADWHERETFDLIGIAFENHPDLRRILMPEDWIGHPLRKDYEVQEVYHGIRVKYENRIDPDQQN